MPQMTNDNKEVEKNDDNQSEADHDNKIINDKADFKLGNILNRLKSLDRSRKISDTRVNFVTGDFIVPSSKEVKIKLVALSVIIICNIFIFGLVYLVINLQGKKHEYDLEQLVNEKSFIESQIDVLKDVEENAGKLRKDIEIAHKLLNNHTSWDAFFEIIEKYTLANVYYNSLNIDTSGNLRLDAIATDYFNLNEQLNIFRNHPEYFSKVEFASVTVDKDLKTGKVNGIKFFASMQVSPSIFYTNN